MNIEKLNGYARAFKEVCGIVNSVVEILEKDGYRVYVDLDALDNDAHTFFGLYLLLAAKDGKHVERWIDVELNDYMMCVKDQNNQGLINSLLNLDNWHVGVRGE